MRYIVWVERLHHPVMLYEVIENIGPIEGHSFADLTFGEGGHSETLLDRGASVVIGIDRDREALDRYRQDGRFKEDHRLQLRHLSFSSFVANEEHARFDGVLMDLGVSTRQLLSPERGFSFCEDAPLDMRMDRSPSCPNAIEKLRESPLLEITKYLKLAGIRSPHKVARKLKEKVMREEINSTFDLSQLGRLNRPGRHPATNLFLAVRLLVNEEFDEIKVLAQVLRIVKPGGKLLVLTFHSAEDRLVKKQLAMLSGKCVCEDPICRCSRIAMAKPLFSKPLVPSRHEVRMNPRARSAKLRGVSRLMGESALE